MECDDPQLLQQWMGNWQDLIDFDVIPCAPLRMLLRRSRRVCEEVLPRPNKRLKLTGGDRSKGTGALCAGAHELSFHNKAPSGQVARSLSAIR